ncbi:MAG: hypothetical protein Q4P72_02900, partial [Eubacteriales bacterium]|nr:hypothetical protein [Eubacteriales bacterium]
DKKKSDDKKSEATEATTVKSDESKSEEKTTKTEASEAKSSEATTSVEATANAQPTQTYDEALKQAQEAEAKSRSEKIAEKMLTAVEAGQDLQKLVQENKDFVVNSEFSPQGENPVSVTNKKAQIQVSDLSTWLYDAKRKQGDTTLIKTDRGHFYVAVYAKRGPDKRLSADIQARILTKETLNALSDDEHQKMVDELLKRFPAEVKSVEDLKAFKLGDLEIDAALDLPGFTAGHGLNDVSMKQILSTTVKENTPLVIEENGNYYLIFVTARGPLESYRSDIQKQLREEAYADELKAMKESTENAVELKGLAKHFFYDSAEALKPAA